MGSSSKGLLGSPYPRLVLSTRLVIKRVYDPGVFFTRTVLPLESASMVTQWRDGSLFVFPILTFLILQSRIQRMKYSGVLTIVAFTGSYLLLANIRYFPYSWLVYLISIFIFGVLIRLGGIPKGKLRYLAATAQVLAPIAIIWICYTGNLNFMNLLLAVWVWSLSVDLGFVARFFSKPTMIVAGSASYSLYMLHWLVFGYISVFVASLDIQNIWLLKLITLFTLGVLGLVSWACWKYFEIPNRRRMNRYFERLWPLAHSIPEGS